MTKSERVYCWMFVIYFIVGMAWCAAPTSASAQELPLSSPVSLSQTPTISVTQSPGAQVEPRFMLTVISSDTMSWLGSLAGYGSSVSERLGADGLPMDTLTLYLTRREPGEVWVLRVSWRDQYGMPHERTAVNEMVGNGGVVGAVWFVEQTVRPSPVGGDGYLLEGWRVR